MCLDWCNEGEEEEERRRRGGEEGGEEGGEADPHRPTVLILPGMTGQLLKKKLINLDFLCVISIK